MNLQRVTFTNDKDVCLVETGVKIGEICSSHGQVIEVHLNNGVHVYAHYGTKDDSGKFHIFCRNTQACGKNCFATESPECRYNRKYADRSGYYVDIDAVLSVW